MKSFFRTPDKRKLHRLLLGDLLCISLGLWAAFALQMVFAGRLRLCFEPVSRLPLFPKVIAVINLMFFFSGIAGLFGGLYLLVFYISGLYELEATFNRKRTIFQLGTALVFSELLTFILSRIAFHSLFALNVWLMHMTMLFFLLWIWRMIFFRRIARDPFRVMIVGRNGLSKKAVDLICSNGIKQFFEFSYCDSETELSQSTGPLSNGNRYDLIVYPFDRSISDKILISLVEKKFEGIGICNSLTFYKNTTGSIPVFDLDPQWLVNLSISLSLTQKLQQRIKRMMDISFSLFLIALCSPIMILISVLIKITSKGPVLFSQKRAGMANREFTAHKFRTMVEDAESRSGPVWAKKHDPRVTPVGRILRKTGLDELPQLFDVLWGKMSFIGPRPIREVFEKEFAERIPFYFLRNMVKPGLTGWGQVGNFDPRSPEGPRKRFEHDLFYIHEYSLFFDAVIILKTIRKLFWAKGE
jgi:exopolysaccharide biosynthesis polyprenyl glycosylphosphotransferase